MLILYSRISENFHSWLIERYLGEFEEEFQNKVRKYRRWQDAQLSLLGRLLLSVGGEILGKSKNDLNPIHYTEFGKPFLETNLYFNISHSADIVICALSNEYELGIDIEKINDIDLEDFRHYMSVNEWAEICDSENAIGDFYKFWTQKEAVVKAVGTGLLIPINSFEIKNCKAVVKNENYLTMKIEIAPDYYCNLAIKSKLKYINNVTIKEISIRN